jgi:hypothetical protein
MAAAIVFELHGRLLRDIAVDTGLHFQGLRGAASHLRRVRLINPAMAKKLARLDDTFAVLRHISVVSADRVASDLSAAMRAPDKFGPVWAPMAKAAEVEEIAEVPASMCEAAAAVGVAAGAQAEEPAAAEAAVQAPEEGLTKLARADEAAASGPAEGGDSSRRPVQAAWLAAKELPHGTVATVARSATAAAEVDVDAAARRAVYEQAAEVAMLAALARGEEAATGGPAGMAQSAFGGSVVIDEVRMAGYAKSADVAWVAAIARAEAAAAIKVKVNNGPREEAWK